MRGSQTLKRPWHATTQLHLLNFISHQGRAPRLLSALLSGIAGDAFYHPHIGKASIIIPEDTDSGLWSDLPKITQLVSGRSGTRNHNLWFLAQCPFHFTLIFFSPSLFSPGSTFWLQVITALSCDPKTAHSDALSSRHWHAQQTPGFPPILIPSSVLSLRSR